MMLHIFTDRSRSKLTNIQDVDVQPNAVDLRLGKVFKILNNQFTLSEDEKIHRGGREVEPTSEGWFNLDPGTYEVIMENDIKIADGEAGFVITRSTLNRNGIFLTSGLYDSGYHGLMAGAMHVNVGPFSIKRGTRIGQFLLFKAESLHAYDGSYGYAEDGTVKKDDKRYVE
jgi:deoxycytidine triphosphate deaminase